MHIRTASKRKEEVSSWYHAWIKGVIYSKLQIHYVTRLMVYMQVQEWFRMQMYMHVGVLVLYVSGKVKIYLRPHVPSGLLNERVCLAVLLGIRPAAGRPKNIQNLIVFLYTKIMLVRCNGKKNNIMIIQI
jgi:hypothetical protein